MGNLTATGVKAAKRPGRHGDGDGLYLVVHRGGSRSWVVRVQKDGKRRDIGLGSAKKVSLSKAREKAAEVRSQIEAGLDPVAERRKRVSVPTFREAAALFHSEQKKAWRNTKHADQWLSTLKTYAFPTIGDFRVNSVEASHVRDLLAAIWVEKNQTARRVRQRIATIIDWAVGKGYRDASLQMAIINRALPAVTARAGHHAAMPYADVANFMARLRERETWGRLALETAILTAARSGEIRGATWNEVDLEKGLWTIPAERMKGGREHVVPLSAAARRVFARALRLSSGTLCFEGMKRGKPMSDMTPMKVLRDMGECFTMHGFRSTFKDWASETTGFANELSEAALAHSIQSKTEAAYRRGNLLERRRDLMEAWGSYCDDDRNNVVSIAAAS